MSDDENEEEAKPFCVEIAKQGKAKCKQCKQNCVANELRIGKLAYNPFGGGLMKQWHHLTCLFEQFLKQRVTTKRIESIDDIDGIDNLEEDDKEKIIKCIEESENKIAKKYGTKYSPKAAKDKEPKKKTPKKEERKPVKDENSSTSNSSKDSNKDHKDNLFREFRRLIAEVTNESSYLEKSAIMNKMFKKGSDGTSFKGDLIQWVRLLLPGVIKRTYNLQSKQLIKLFSILLETNREEMMEHLEQGDIGETIQHFYENSDTVKPSKKSLLHIQEVDEFLEELTNLTKEDEQVNHFKKFIKKCTANDLKIIIRLIKHDLRMNAGAKHVLDAVHADAYSAFQSSRDLELVINKILNNKDNSSSDKKEIKASIKVMTPVLPMLAEACKSVEQAMKKCPNGMYSEIKYDGERVQVHKSGSEFKYFSRSLKPVLPYKVNHFKDYIPKAFPHAKELILDSEVLLIDTKTDKPLPFGSLGIHKKNKFEDATVCLFIFDCIYYNGESLGHKPMKERRRILKENMTEIKNHIMFSEIEEIHKPNDLANMISKVLNLGLEGLVLKDLKSVYEPGKRHWLKVKKDYLLDGAMADSADLIVLGAWYGTGKKGGMMSVFLMGCYDKYAKKFCTVTKVHTGHDDKTLEQLQTELDMVKISGDSSKTPSWLECTKTMVPDFVASDPKNQPVWEITGAEFTQHEVHTAEGISIRFPRVTKIRSDKTWETATNLEELKVLFKNSKDTADYSSLLKNEYDKQGPSTSKQMEIDQDDQSDEEKQIKDEIIEPVKNNKRKSDEKETKPSKKIKQEETKSSKSRKKTISNFADLIKEAEGNKTEEVKTKKVKTEEVKTKQVKTEEVKLEKTVAEEELPAVKDAPCSIRYANIFENIKLWPSDQVREDNEALLRHFVVCNGDLLSEEQRMLATHIVYNIKSVSEEEMQKDFPPSVRHVTVDWIKNSIGNNEIQDIRPYTVQLK